MKMQKTARYWIGDFFIRTAVVVALVWAAWLTGWLIGSFLVWLG